MSVKDLTMMVMPDERMWIDSDSLVEYLRMVQQQANDQAEAAYTAGKMPQYAAGMAVQDILRQIADNIVVTGMAAREEIRGRRVAR